LKNILILGGTGFVGRILSEKLTLTDNSVTLFNRGKRNPGLFPDFQKLNGDRNTEDIFKIATGNWDVVIDFSGFFPDNIETIAGLLKGSAGRYIFISSASVYDVAHPSGLTYPIKEDFHLLQCTYEQRIDKHPFNFYGNKKAECERVLLNSNWLDVMIFRPALIYGRYDPTDRFYYWLYRAKTQDEILIPDDGITQHTNTYSEDFAQVLFNAVEIKEHSPVYNAVTHQACSIKNMVIQMANLFNRKPAFINAPGDFLTKNNVSEWVSLPLWIKDFSFIMDNSKLLKDMDIKFKKFEESLEESSRYYSSLNWYVPKEGITLSQEKELISKLKQPE
jgi:2'-hydroxyisoflavone reductase